MYVPRHFGMPADLQRRILTAGGVGDLVTAHADGLVATHLPYLFQPDAENGRLVLHVARANSQWRTPVLGEALFLITPASDYVSSLWYPSAEASGHYVPTWDYVALHLYGELVVHDDPDWTGEAVAALMARHEDRIGPADMPPDYLAGQLRAIVGLELRITRVEAKAKLSQNRTPADVRGVIDGLTGAGADVTAGLVAEFALPEAERRATLVAAAAERHRPGPDSLGGGRFVGTADPR